jgi:membrane-associated protein
VVFIENGVFFGFFLPGDTLLLLAGAFCATKVLDTSIYTLLASILLAAITGNMVGYAFGKKMGDSLFRKKDTLLFKKKYVFAAEAFFNRYGGKALMMGRFLPVIRTFAPIFAGIVHLDYKKFISYNIAGGILWVFTMVLLGFTLGKIWPEMLKYIEYIILGIIVITWIPVIRTYLKERKNTGKTL